jgi:hypothetical protein
MKVGVVVTAILLALVPLLVLTEGVRAAIPDPYCSQVEPVIVGGSSSAGVADGFVILVRDNNYIPLPAKLVTIQFMGSGVRSYQQQESGTTVDCSTQVLSRRSGPGGLTVFHPRIGGYQNSPTIQIRAESMLLASVPARSTDLNGDGTTDLRDLDLFRTNFLFHPTAAETDYNQDGRTDGLDLDIMRQEFMSGAHGTPCP